MRSSIEVHFFKVNVPVYTLFTEEGMYDRNAYPSAYQELGGKELKKTFPNNKGYNIQTLKTTLQSHNIFTISERSPNGVDTLYTSAKTTNNIVVFILATCTPGGVEITARSSAQNILPAVISSVEGLL